MIKLFNCSLILLFILALAACTGMQPRQEAPHVAKEKVQQASADEAATPPAKQQKAKLSQQTRNKIRQQLETGDFPVTLKMIRREVKNGTVKEDLRAEYLKALNGAIVLGGIRLAENQPDQAGLLFRAAHDNFPKDPGQAAEVLLSREALQAQLDLCAEELMSKGLTAYRVGDLGRAVSEWKKIIAFNPDHHACSNAIRTAEMQRATLEKLGSDN